jgi:hypothetical protein
MRNTLTTANALTDCDHNHHIEARCTICKRCGARKEPASADPSRPQGEGTWKDPDLVERLKRDLSEELPIVIMELEEVELASNEIAHSLETIRSVGSCGEFSIDLGALSAIIETARGWSAAVARLRRRFEGR